MRLSSVHLDRFRSHRTLHATFDDGDIQAFIGENGAGKTNIVEALAVLSLGRSVLGAEPQDMILWGEQFYKVRAEIVTDAGDRKTLESVCQVSPRKQKAFFINDVRVPFAEFVGSLPTVTFLPQDLGLFSGPPDRRRSVLDGLLAQLDRQFLALRMEYERILKQRNALLKRIGEGVAREQELDPWDSDIARVGGVLQERRLRMLIDWQADIPTHIRLLGEAWTSIVVDYVRKTTATEHEAIADELQAQLLHYRSRDCIVGSTTVGPHRDDWRILVDGRDIATFASRGQQRASLLALLFACMQQFCNRKHEQPIILLDDVFSEFDDRHQGALLRSLSGHQTFLTATHLPALPVATLRRWSVDASGVHRQQ